MIRSENFMEFYQGSMYLGGGLRSIFRKLPDMQQQRIEPVRIKVIYMQPLVAIPVMYYPVNNKKKRRILCEDRFPKKSIDLTMNFSEHFWAYRRRLCSSAAPIFDDFVMVYICVCIRPMRVGMWRVCGCVPC